LTRHIPDCLRSAFILCLFLGGVQILFPGLSSAQEDDPGFIRALQTDSAPIENYYYLTSYFNNVASPYYGFYLYGEGLFALGKDLGVEMDFPNLITREPLGTGPAILGPIGLALRYEFYHFGDWNSQTAGAFSIEAGGSYGFSNHTFPWVGSSWCVEAMGGYRVGNLFLQGNYTYQGAIDPQVATEWQANTSLGYRLGSDWYVQTEADFTDVTSPYPGTSWTFIPQIAFQPDEWLFELGESLNETPAGVTQLMVARAL
jgi:hypothetical protein